MPCHIKKYWNYLTHVYTFFIVYQVLVCAPSNVAVDQLAEKISATGLKVKKWSSNCSCILSPFVIEAIIYWHIRIKSECLN